MNDKLSEKSFHQLRDFYTRLVRTKDDLHGLLIAMAIDDIGKDSSLSEEMAQQGVKATYADHSDLVHRQHWRTIGPKLNISQVVRGECPPASLEILSTLQGKGQGVNLQAMVTFLDVAGAGGHADTRSCIVMSEPVFQAYMSGVEAFDTFANGSIPSPRACYDHILEYRAKNLQQLGFNFSHPLRMKHGRSLGCFAWGV
ncbi:hypothetical protein IFM58399_05234 [Aspergillus lentulus]|uniref:Uncharacterized protein n=1 Tax=Aspergillus lentulus TaxID=293939 RepID=A0AAN5YJ92_ASPLE|nr:uncharacterized protein IFM58399_05234 [Aspergillus lentulus]KAF4151662.1 hypothetical protein CNMCM6069_003261 [Aspergillus lentulus]KAF4179317.1 hypothetical protein CNMCM8060_003180 [Aspergillus lentulus]KAF4185070.1 hypothetical protein CNMCM7927_007095 [Aspergillus lentulus]KAF4198795.1 hypothetical protein CNMCM8694_008145 [Aspergillus lentulus]KAF4202367.1 hypothetical protein CNMCM8927_000238 [Aspergillus lentulus]